MIRVGGMTPLTTIDFPGRLAAVLFLQGCPWRCDYCHNPHLLPARAGTGVAWTSVLAFLERRRGLLDGVVFSGGEPTLQAGLGKAIDVVRGLGYSAALHTGGMYPERLRPMLARLDWIGLDVKAPWHLYDSVTRRHGSGRKVGDSLHDVLHSGVAHECRTTWHPGLFPENELHHLADELRDAGVRHWALQECRIDGHPHPEWKTPDLRRLGEGFASFVFRGNQPGA
ncbi:anaerobic ribonucleoside-triphosphate reductase activating protein [Rhodanobacter sp. 115]|uniref:anaerobic ribonucleoside-triphosphate reductase activating protein n=1 Tax=Rhodanobacter sp. FW021-MT20 TaxID=1162282 RepID=UPI000260DB9B|nr:anaerobic ribonucleoside-triphosphate reductase activating protein [Rhodanobacter sp. 115]EIL86854.1 activase of anaerobic class III ribonucleotide reductase [Rhodanobacter sp. 115]